MEVHALKISITDDDLNDLVRRHVPNDLPIEDLRLRIEVDGIHLQGVYPLFVQVNFETVWELGVSNNVVGARLAQLKAMGIPGNIFRSAILKLLEDSVRRHDSLALKDDTILIDLQKFLAREGVKCVTNLRSIHFQVGSITVEAGLA